jgi:hypothetical protein
VQELPLLLVVEPPLPLRWQIMMETILTVMHLRERTEKEPWMGIVFIPIHGVLSYPWQCMGMDGRLLA